MFDTSKLKSIHLFLLSSLLKKTDILIRILDNNFFNKLLKTKFVYNFFYSISDNTGKFIYLLYCGINYCVESSIYGYTCYAHYRNGMLEIAFPGLFYSIAKQLDEEEFIHMLHMDIDPHFTFGIYKVLLEIVYKRTIIFKTMWENFHIMILSSFFEDNSIYNSMIYIKIFVLPITMIFIHKGDDIYSSIDWNLTDSVCITALSGAINIGESENKVGDNISVSKETSDIVKSPNDIEDSLFVDVGGESSQESLKRAFLKDREDKYDLDDVEMVKMDNFWQRRFQKNTGYYGPSMSDIDVDGECLATRGGSDLILSVNIDREDVFRINDISFSFKSTLYTSVKGDNFGFKINEISMK